IAAPSAPPPRAAALEPVAPTPFPAAAAVPAMPPAPRPPDAPSHDAVAALPPPVPPTPGSGFLWPVQGRIVAAFGTEAVAPHNDGINIAAPAGTPVRAAAAGVVTYAGNELRGYGNLLLIQHDGPYRGFTTAYAHNAKLLVKRFDHVARGQVIA